MPVRPMKPDPAMLPIRRRSLWDRWATKVAIAILTLSTATYAWWEVRQRQAVDGRTNRVDQRLIAIEQATRDRGPRGERILKNQEKCTEQLEQIRLELERIRGELHGRRKRTH